MNYVYEEINKLNKEIITLQEASFIYKRYSLYLNCSNSIIIEFIKKIK